MKRYWETCGFHSTLTQPQKAKEFIQIIVTKKGPMKKVAVDVRKNGKIENKKHMDIL